MSGLVGIDFCVNDPDSGLWAGRVEGVQLYYRDGGDPLFELEPRTDRAPTITRLESGALRISGKRWPILREKEYVGNWCWNRYWFDRDVAANMLIWMQARRLFNLTCGEQRLFNAWRWEGRLAEFRPLILTQLAEAS